MSALHLGLYDNITSTIGAMATEIDQRRVALQSIGSLLQDALGSLVHGFLPTTLIPRLLQFRYSTGNVHFE